MSAALGLAEALVHSNRDLQKSFCTKQQGPLRLSSKERARWAWGGLSKQGGGPRMWGMCTCVYVCTPRNTQGQRRMSVSCPLTLHFIPLESGFLTEL